MLKKAGANRVNSELQGQTMIRLGSDQKYICEAYIETALCLDLSHEVML